MLYRSFTCDFQWSYVHIEIVFNDQVTTLTKLFGKPHFTQRSHQSSRANITMLAQLVGSYFFSGSNRYKYWFFNIYVYKWKCNNAFKNNIYGLKRLSPTCTAILSQKNVCTKPNNHYIYKYEWTVFWISEDLKMKSILVQGLGLTILTTAIVFNDRRNPLKRYFL